MNIQEGAVSTGLQCVMEKFRHSWAMCAGGGRGCGGMHSLRRISFVLLANFMVQPPKAKGASESIQISIKN